MIPPAKVEIRILIVGPSKPTGGKERCVILHASLDLGKGFRLYHLDTSYHPVVRRSMVLKLVHSCFLILRIIRIIRERSIDLVHIHSGRMDLFRNIQIQSVVQRMGAKSVMHVHSGYFDRSFQFYPRFLRRHVESGLNHSNAVICLSERGRGSFISTFTGAMVYVLENAIDVAAFREIGERRDYTGKDEFNALFLGRVTKMKGIFELVRVAKIMRDRNRRAHFILAGDSKHQEIAELLREVHNAGLDDWFELPGEVAGFARDELFRNADCFILPSHEEGMPIAILEAFAAGLPVIATKVGAVPEIIRSGENGILVEVGDVEGIVDALIQLSSAELRKELGKAAFKDAMKRFSAERWVSKLSNIYSEVATTS